MTSASADPDTVSTPRWRVELDSLLAPATLAIVGASPEAMITKEIVANCRQLGFAGRLVAVNGKYQEVLGLPCFPNLEAIPGKVDCVVLGVSKRAAFQVLEDCVKKGVHSVVLPAGGFAESGAPEDLALQKKLNQYAVDNQIRISGPNCEGNISMPGCVATMYGPLPQGMRQGGVGVVSQSGGILNAIIEAGHHRGLGFSRLISSGNEAVINCCDYIEYMLDDPETKVVTASIEGFREGPRLTRLAERAMEIGKPLVILKTGRSEKGGQAAASHTGSVAGSFDMQAAVLRQFGVILVDSIDELVETSALLLKGRIPKADGVCVVLISGGGAVLSADVAARIGLNVPDPGDATQATLTQMMPGVARIFNPFDTGVGFQSLLDPTFMPRCLAALEKDEQYGVLALVGKRNGSGLVQKMGVQMAELAAHSDKAFASVSTISETLDQESALFKKSGAVALLQDLDCGFKAIKNLLDFARAQRRHRAGKGRAPAQAPRAEVAALLPAAGASTVMTERAAKAVFGKVGLPVTREALARTAEEAAAHAQGIGFPVALKVESADIPHKTEAKAIRLHIGNAADAKAAFDAIMTAARTYKPDARIDGVLVQEMAQPGLEMIVGSTQDPHFGPIVMVGLGGIYVEVFKDVSLRPAPVTLEQAHEMIGELRSQALLKGARGAPPADVDALAQTVVGVSRLAAEHAGRIQEIDLNPVIVYAQGKGVKIVDALIRTQ